MSKKRFIQSVVVRRLPPLAELQNTIRYAEQAWDELSQRGYGADQPGQPREMRNWYAELAPAQKAGFDAFWKAFDLKKDRNGAAMRWTQLCQRGYITPEQYQAVTDAAAQEAQRPLTQGQVRKMAQGWLYEMRWLDYSKAPVDDSKRKRMEHNRLVNEIAALNSLYQAGKDPKIKQQLDTLQDKLNQLRNQERK